MVNAEIDRECHVSITVIAIVRELKLFDAIVDLQIELIILINHILILKKKVYNNVKIYFKVNIEKRFTINIEIVKEKTLILKMSN